MFEIRAILRCLIPALLPFPLKAGRSSVGFRLSRFSTSYLPLSLSPLGLQPREGGIGSGFAAAIDRRRRRVGEG